MGKNRIKIILFTSLTLNLFLTIALLVGVFHFHEELYVDYVKFRTNRIVMLGDSITERGGKWEFLLGRLDVVNSGYRGMQTRELKQFLIPAVYSHNPKICFIMGGVNDFIAEMPVQTVFDNLKTIAIRLKKHHTIPILQSTLLTAGNPDYNDKIIKLNVMLREYADKERIGFINLNQYLAKGGKLRKELTTDGIHLKKEAYKIWSREIIKVLEAFGI